MIGKHQEIHVFCGSIVGSVTAAFRNSENCPKWLPAILNVVSPWSALFAGDGSPAEGYTDQRCHVQLHRRPVFFGASRPMLASIYWFSVGVRSVKRSNRSLMTCSIFFYASFSVWRRSVEGSNRSSLTCTICLC